MLTAKQIKDIVDLERAGETIGAISKKLDIPWTTVSRCIRPQKKARMLMSLDIPPDSFEWNSFYEQVRTYAQKERSEIANSTGIAPYRMETIELLVTRANDSELKSLTIFYRGVWDWFSSDYLLGLKNFEEDLIWHEQQEQIAMKEEKAKESAKTKRGSTAKSPPKAKAGAKPQSVQSPSG